jgi:hypothetical protein
LRDVHIQYHIATCGEGHGHAVCRPHVPVGSEVCTRGVCATALPESENVNWTLDESHFPFYSLALSRFGLLKLVWCDGDWCDLIGIARNVAFASSVV